jgi:predicted deacylase
VTAIPAPYLDPDARAQRLRALAERARGESVVYGESVLGEPLVAVRVPSSAGSADVPKVLCCANIHGIEFAGGLVALALLERVADGDPSVAVLRERAELWVVPCMNPDGYRRTWDADGEGAVAQLRTNANGVDLNRNFPLPHGATRRARPGAGSTSPGAATYCGTGPLCEPETRALAELCEAQRFHASADLHCFMGTLIPARTIEPVGYAAYKQLCRSFAAAQPHTRYRRLATRVLDTWTGEQEDHLHHALDCWAVCVETFSFFASFAQHLRAPSPFWRFNPHDPSRWIDNDVPGLVAYYAAALALPRPSTLTSGPC